MVRKGSKKVRTGCITCKVRKIKCDETRPCCRRCTNTGRNCDGYAPQGRQPTPAAHLAVTCQYLRTKTESRRRIQTEHDMILDDLDYSQDVAPCSKKIPWGSRKEEYLINE
ncbi:hypothetical protein FOVSG1_006910 [Fusarium oxysporum f. sp. vasinfectum]